MRRRNRGPLPRDTTVSIKPLLSQGGAWGGCKTRSLQRERLQGIGYSAALRTAPRRLSPPLAAGALANAPTTMLRGSFGAFFFRVYGLLQASLTTIHTKKASAIRLKPRNIRCCSLQRERDSNCEAVARSPLKIKYN